MVLTPRRRSILAPRLMLRMDLSPSSFLLVFLLEAVVATARPTSISRHHLLGFAQKWGRAEAKGRKRGEAGRQARIEIKCILVQRYIGDLVQFSSHTEQ